MSNANKSITKQQIEERLRCSICLERYKMPKVLPCQHTFCLSPCLENLFDPTIGKIKCAQCRSKHRIPLGGIQQFPNNLTIMDFLELNITNIDTNDSLNATNTSIRNSSNEDSNVQSLEKCSQCLKQTQSPVKCLHCTSLFCSECKSVHVVNLTNEIHKKINDFKHIIPNLKQKLDSLDKIEAMIMRSNNALKHDISSHIDELIGELKTRERMLFEEIDNCAQSQIENIYFVRDKANNDLIKLSSICCKTEEFLKQMVNKKSVEEIEKRRNIFDTCETKIKSIEKKISFTSIRQIFNNVHFDNLIEIIRNFGELDYEEQNIIFKERQPASHRSARMNVDVPVHLMTRNVVEVRHPRHLKPITQVRNLKRVSYPSNLNEEQPQLVHSLIFEEVQTQRNNTNLTPIYHQNASYHQTPEPQLNPPQPSPEPLVHAQQNIINDTMEHENNGIANLSINQANNSIQEPILIAENRTQSIQTQRILSARRNEARSLIQRETDLNEENQSSYEIIEPLPLQRNVTSLQANNQRIPTIRPRSCHIATTRSLTVEPTAATAGNFDSDV